MFGATTADLPTQLALRVDRDVIDKTGLAGMLRQPLLRAPDASGPSTVTALQQQLGLKLEARKSSAEFLVIDRIEKPAGNWSFQFSVGVFSMWSTMN
jgi:uncharacterized protein (TIGR03435 family)